jgi:cytidylate kinase
MNQVPVIAIDGPSGSGKGTVAAATAEKLGWHFLDSGALYRLLGFAALSRKISPGDEVSLARLAQEMHVEFDFSRTGNESILLDGIPVGDQLRNESVAAAASQLAAFAAVRAALLDLQHGFRKAPGLVADGRDMGTVVFPDAFYKVFLTASVEERANRRHMQLKDKGLDANILALLGEIRERDARDASRAISPLIPATDAELIDTTKLSIDRVVQKVLKQARKRLAERS